MDIVALIQKVLFHRLPLESPNEIWFNTVTNREGRT
jgi:hypothetical protein